MSTTQIIIFSLFMILNIPIIKWLWKQFFADMENFMECLHYLWQWDLFSAMKGELARDWNMSMKIKFFFGLIVVLIFLEFAAAVKLEELIVG